MPVLKRPAAAVAKPAAKSKDAPSAKKPRASADPLRMKVVFDSFDLSDAADSACEFMKVMLKQPLEAFKDERHPVEAQVIGWAEAFMNEIDTGLKTKLSQAEKDYVASEEAVVAGEKAIAMALETREAKADAVQKQKLALAEVTKAFKAAREAHVEACTVRDGHAGELLVVETKRDRLLAVQNEHLKPLVESAEGVDVEGHFKHVNEAFDHFELDQSVRVAIPSALKKVAVDRGAFDLMVISKLNEEFAGKLSAFEATLSSAADTRQKNEQTVVAAEKQFAAARDQLLKVADEFNVRQDQHTEATTAHSIATTEQKTKTKAVTKNNIVKEKAAKTLAEFQEGALAHFFTLRDRTPPPPEPVVEESVSAETVAAKEAELPAAVPVIASEVPAVLAA